MRNLLEAYLGFYEGQLENVNEETMRALIKTHTPKERLAIFLTWNGIIGYTESIYAIATGEI